MLRDRASDATVVLFIISIEVHRASNAIGRSIGCYGNNVRCDPERFQRGAGDIGRCFSVRCVESVLKWLAVASSKE
jgi:hypothetical protein